MHSEPLTKPIVVLGAGGRAGRAIVARATARGTSVTAVVRRPADHAELDRPGVDLVRGDATDPASVEAVTARAGAIVNAVSPFSAPPASFDDFDASYYETLTNALVAAAVTHGITRIAEIGLAATLRVGEGRLCDDTDAFPAFLRPFAVARLRGLEAWRRSGDAVDWLMLTPPPTLGPEAPSTGRYRLGDDTLDTGWGSIPLSYDDLAEAILDEISTPTRHREQAAVYGRSGD